MEAANLKIDIISWVSGLNDRKLLEELYLWAAAHKMNKGDITLTGLHNPKRAGELTEGFGIWKEDDMTLNTIDDRKKIWQTERNAW